MYNVSDGLFCSLSVIEIVIVHLYYINVVAFLFTVSVWKSHHVMFYFSIILAVSTLAQQPFRWYTFCYNTCSASSIWLLVGRTVCYKHINTTDHSIILYPFYLKVNAFSSFSARHAIFACRAYATSMMSICNIGGLW